MKQLLSDAIDLFLAGGSADTFPVKFLALVIEEVTRSREKFPSNAANHCAAVEEVGEVAKALMYEPWPNVIAECVQVAATMLRLAMEGDSTMLEFRASQGLSSPGVYDACSSCGSVVSLVVSQTGNVPTAETVLSDTVERIRLKIAEAFARPVAQCSHLNNCRCDAHTLAAVRDMLPDGVPMRSNSAYVNAAYDVVRDFRERGSVAAFKLEKLGTFFPIPEAAIFEDEAGK